MALFFKRILLNTEVKTFKFNNWNQTNADEIDVRSLDNLLDSNEIIEI